MDEAKSTPLRLTTMLAATEDVLPDGVSAEGSAGATQRTTSLSASKVALTVSRSAGSEAAEPLTVALSPTL